MKIRKMLTPVAMTLSLATAQAAPVSMKTPGLAGARFQGDKITFARAERDVLDGARRRIASKGDQMVSIQGTPANPARLVSPSLELRTQSLSIINLSAFFFSGAKSKIKLTLLPRGSKAPVKVEAECYVGDVSNGKITLEDTVSGFYEDAAGRHELKGDIVTLQAFDNAVSVVQDGRITLSAPAN